MVSFSRHANQNLRLAVFLLPLASLVSLYYQYPKDAINPSLNFQLEEDETPWIDSDSFKASLVRQNNNNDNNTTDLPDFTEWDDLFPLSCPYALDGNVSMTWQSQAQTQTHTIALVYHIGMVGNWKEIVYDQLRTLHVCGLGHWATSISIVYSGLCVDELQSLLKLFSFPTKVRVLEGTTKIPYEATAMKEVSNTCSVATATDTTVIYFHNKGSSRYATNWRQYIQSGPTDEEKYVKSLFWRKAMEYFTIERPQHCLDQIQFHNVSTCGILRSKLTGKSITRPYWHYSGNFWMASCDYLRRLPPFDEALEYIQNTTKNQRRRKQLVYIAAELWVGWEMKEIGFSTDFITLFETSSNRKEGLAKENLSTQILWPSEYLNL